MCLDWILVAVPKTTIPISTYLGLCRACSCLLKEGIPFAWGVLNCFPGWLKIGPHTLLPCRLWSHPQGSLPRYSEWATMPGHMTCLQAPAQMGLTGQAAPAAPTLPSLPAVAQHPPAAVPSASNSFEASTNYQGECDPVHDATCRGPTCRRGNHCCSGLAKMSTESQNACIVCSGWIPRLRGAAAVAVFCARPWPCCNHRSPVGGAGRTGQKRRRGNPWHMATEIHRRRRCRLRCASLGSCLMCFCREIGQSNCPSTQASISSPPAPYGKACACTFLQNGIK